MIESKVNKSLIAYDESNTSQISITSRNNRLIERNKKKLGNTTFTRLVVKLVKKNYLMMIKAIRKT